MGELDLKWIEDIDEPNGCAMEATWMNAGESGSVDTVAGGLGEEERVAENIYIKKMEKEKLENLEGARSDADVHYMLMLWLQSETT
ncbi:hypothetical protein MKW98_011909 [Papaver atlanticum]|uniref:Uncharacterized protein n=1 Tax=Papaver atlanticum TaxID=357466 RepID=A0AAD4T5S6_9MAGN|nr:hypothetical protein MKW98_011909 [Papaver atlanticum]